MWLIKKLGWKGMLIAIVSVVAVITVLVALFAGSSLEKRKTELSNATLQLSRNASHVDRLITDWRETWQGVALGQIKFQEGIKKLDDISVGALEVSNAIERMATPKWLNRAPKEEFNNMKKDMRTACSALAVASKAGAQMLKSGLLTPKDLTTMAGYSKDATDYLNKSTLVLSKFKLGYGLEEEPVKAE